MEALEKRVQVDIATTVKKATAHLKAAPVDPHAGLNSMLIQAHHDQIEGKEASDPVSIVSIKDPAMAIKQSLVEVLNSKASLDDLR